MRKYFLLCVLFFGIGCFSQNKLEVFFDFNKDVPNESSQIKLKQWISENKNAEITKMFGYCDSVDDSSYNKELAMRRINSVLLIFKENAIKVIENAALKSFGKDFKYSKIQRENRKVTFFYNRPVDKKEINKKPEVKTINSDIDEEINTEAENIAALVKEEKLALASKFVKAKKGEIVRINNINFQLNSERVIPSSVPLLNELLQIMLDNPKMIIEIHGHICCNPNPNDTKLSFRRALMIFKYLSDRGIPINRLAYKGFGSNDPIYKVPERNEKERAANRRVEILIVAK